MSHQPTAFRRFILPDPLESARRGERLSGEVPIVALARFSESLAEREGAVSFELQGEEEGGECYLDLWISTEAKVQCQRCLQPMAWPLELDARFLLVPQGRALPDDELNEDSFDPIVAERDLDVLALVEDELLLGLPIAPRHEKCTPPQPRGQDDSASPFAALAKLRGAGSNED